MLDQNTDRMWYVIGAVLIGAAIIFGFNVMVPSAFASVGGMMVDVLDDTMYRGPIELNVDVGGVNGNDTMDVRIHADSEAGIESIEWVDVPAPVETRTMMAFNGVDEYVDMVYDYGPTQSFAIGAWLNDVDTMNFITDHSHTGGWRLADAGGIKVNGESKWKGPYVYEGLIDAPADMLDKKQTFHVLLTWDGSNLHRYINGELVEEYVVEGSFILKTKMVGTRVNSATNVPNGFTSGIIKEFYVYKDRFMKADEVAHLYTNGVDGVTDNLELHYVFDELEGDIIKDRSGNNRHARNYGGRLIDVYNIKENGVYTLKVTDKDGNVREKTVRINQLP